jgi:hypothetical protein
MEQAQKLLDLKSLKAELEDQTKQTNEDIKKLTKSMVTEMEQLGMEQFVSNNTTFYAKSTLHASVPQESREAFMRRLRARKFGQLIKPTINANTLTAFVKEQIAAEGALPKWMEGLVTTFYEPGIGTRKR